MRVNATTPSIPPITSRALNRRELLVSSARVAVGATAVGIALPHAKGAFAQATPGPDVSGYQELTVTVTDEAISASTSEISAGYVLLTVVNHSKTEATAGLLTEPGLTAESLATMAATPTPEDEFPSFLFTATIAGGPQDAQPGETTQAILHVPAGGWAIISDGAQAPLFLTVKEGAEAGQEPAASATITEMEFAFSGLDAGIKSGKQIWKVVNNGAQPHMLVLGMVPSGTTMDQIMATINSQMSGTPVAGALQESDIHDVGGVLLQSPGQTVWPVLDLPAGRYAATCWVPDPKSGMPHVMEGMVSLFDIA